jgi:chlorite dismutase
MTQPPARSLNHFAVFRFTQDYWMLSAEARRNTQGALLAGLRGAAPAVHCYQLFPTAARSDFLVWTATPVENPEAPGEFFAGYVDGTGPLRQYVEPVSVLWGFTKQSEYSSARSRRAMDPFGADRAPYLIVYPFSKTAEWYLMDQDSRQELMNDHIRIGKQYTGVRQLLLYSFGLQDQEFVVVYETDDLSQFSALVHELRSTEARRFTLTDAPVHTALHRPAEAPFALWT